MGDDPNIDVTRSCTATTAKGEPCKARPLEGMDLCAAHAGRKVGRPSDLGPDVTARIVQIIKAGGFQESAAAAAGISRRTFYSWLARGDSDAPEDEPYREFREAVEQAKAEAEARHVVLISQAAAKDWKAAAWLLERHNPEAFAKPSQRNDDAKPAASTPHADPLDALDAEVVELAPRRARRSS